MPITGTSIRGMTAAVSSLGTASNTIAKQPASWSASASSTTAIARSAVRPWER
jgi:hypothetical protein